MSELYDRLMADMKTAMKGHDMVAVNAIRKLADKKSAKKEAKA